jgi:CHAT domain-containing protein/tetratricopeptide (TPR) repeat protein
MALLVLALFVPLADAAAPPARLTPDQSLLQAKRDRLLQRATNLFRDGQVDQAVSTTRKALALERGELGGLSAYGRGWLAWLAPLQEERGQFAEAITSRQELLTWMQQRHSADDWRVVDARLDLEDARVLARLPETQSRRLRQALAWNAQVFRLWQQGRSKEALPLAQKVLAVRRENLGKKHRLTALSWLNLGAQHKSLNHLAEAERCYHQARDLYKAVLGVKHPDYANSLNNLANLYKAMREYRLALPLFEQALEVHREVGGEKQPHYATALHNLAALYRAMGELRLALPLFQQALAIRKEALGEKHPEYAMSLHSLAGLYLRRGEHRFALPLYQQALKLRKEVLGVKDPDYVTSLNNLALVYKEMGEYRLALPLYQQALKLRKEVQGEKHPLYATGLNNLALLYGEMGEYRLALALLKQDLKLSKEVRGERHFQYASSLHNLASLYGDMGEHQLALPLLEKALKIQKEVRGEKHPDYATTLGRLASLYQDIGEDRLALPLFQQALAIRKEVLGEKHPDCANSLMSLAAFYQALGKQGAQLVLAGQSLAITRGHLRDRLSVLSDRQRQQLPHHQAHHLEFFLSGAIGTVPAPLLYEPMVDFKDVTSATIAEQHLTRQQPHLRPRLDELRDLRHRLAAWAGQVPSARALERWRQRFDELDRRKTDLEQQLARASADFAGLRERPTTARVAAVLPARTALVEFFAYRHALRADARRRGYWEPRLLAFVVRADREVVLLELGIADHIFYAIHLWRQSVSAAGSRGADPDAARLLRQRLWQPIAKYLDGIDTVLIAPDGNLASLPFAALPGDKPGTFLLERYTFGYLSSGQQLLLPSAATKGDGLLVLGGADFGTQRETVEAQQRPRNWPALPGAELEAKQIESVFRSRFKESSVGVLRGKRADRSRFLTLLDAQKSERRWRYLHLATHGHFDAPRYALPPSVLGAWSVGAGAAPGLAGTTGSLLASLAAQEPGALNAERGFDPTRRRYLIDEGNPMLLTSLVLAGVNKQGEEGYLSAEEIALQDLSGCELAVLSACETAAGRQAGWQGVQGLQRAFHQAGARHVLASLWSVSDPATSLLMEHFYANLWQKNLPPAQALRQAQLFVMKNPDKVVERGRELLKRLRESKHDEASLAKRGIRPKAKEGLVRPGTTPRSPVAWWAPWVLSGTPSR